MKKILSVLLTTLIVILNTAPSYAGNAYTGKISTWNDLSGNNENLFQSNSTNQPSLSYTSNIGSVTFDGSNSYMLTSDTSFSQFLYSSSGTTIFVVQNSASDTQTGTTLSSSGTSTTRMQVYLPTGNTSRFDYGNATTNSISVSTSTASTLGQHMYMALGNPSTLQILNKDGSTIASGTPSGAVTDPSCALSIGVFYNCNTAVNNGFFNGSISEVIVYNTALSFSNYSKIEGYLANKWSLTSNLPVGHPYKNFAPQGNNPFAVIGVKPSLWLDANNVFGNAYTPLTNSAIYRTEVMFLSLGYASGTVSTSNVYPPITVPNVSNGYITYLRIAGTGSDNGSTSFSLSKNGTTVATITMSNGVSSSSTKLSHPISIKTNDVLKLTCTSAGTIQNASVFMEGTDESF